MRRALAIFVLLGLGGRARADTPHEWHRRELHGGLALAGGVAYVLLEGVFKKDIAPATCRWCDPPGLDVDVRDALKWSNTARANSISNVTAFVLPPVTALGLLFAASWHDRSVGRWLDDGLPVVESAVAFGLVNNLAKLAAARERPFVHFAAAGRPHQDDDDLSFFSGHTGTAFTFAVSAGMVAHLRHYKLEPAIWAGGLALAATTGYLRIAADKHYFTDVLTGAAVGSAIGIAVPTLFHHHLGESATVVPAGDMIVYAGTF